MATAMLMFCAVSIGDASALKCILEWDGYAVPIVPLAQIENVATNALSDDKESHPPAVKANLYLKRGIARYEMKEYTSAANDFQATLAIDPANREAQWRLGIVWAREEKTRNKARSLAEKLTREVPDFAPGFYLAATCKFDREQFEEAIRLAEQATALDDEFSRARGLIAHAFYRLKRFDKCLATTEAILLKPPVLALRLGKVRLVRGISFLAAGEYKRAERELAAARRLEPDEPAIIVYLWYACAHRRKLSTCLALSDEFRRRRPNHRFGHWSASMVLSETGDTERALRSAKRAVGIKGSHQGLAWSAVARAQYRRGNYLAALEAHQKAFNISPGNADTGLRVAFIMSTCADAHFRNNGEQAKKIMEDVLVRLRGTPYHAHGLATLALAHAECGDFDLALKAIASAEEIQSDDPQLHKQLTHLKELFKSKKPFRYDPTKNDRDEFHIPAIVVLDVEY